MPGAVAAFCAGISPSLTLEGLEMAEMHEDVRHEEGERDLPERLARWAKISTYFPP